MIYLDYNATTPLHPQVEDAMQQLWREAFGNPASRHGAGRRAWEAVESAREAVAQWAGGDPDDVIFTSGATESNVLALMGRFEALLAEGRNPVSIRAAVSAIEHPCVADCAQRMIARGAAVHWIPVLPGGQVDVAFFEHHGPFDIVSVMAANHETGAIQPLADIARRLPPSSYFHCDGAQWCGRFAGGMDQWGVSALSLSAHKMYGPKGVGALLLKRGWRLEPILPGSQEAGMRGGTVAAPLIAGMAEAARLAGREAAVENERVAQLRERLWQGIVESGCGAVRTIPPGLACANTLHVRFPGRRGERVVDLLDRQGICCSSGPACASGASEPSPVLQAMGYDEAACWEGVRFSIGRLTTEQEIGAAVREISQRLQRRNPHVA